MIDFSDLRGNATQAINACEKLVSGEYRSLLLVAYPGIGVTMVARRVPTIMGELSEHQRRWINATYEGSHMPAPDSAPFRAPHHSVSAPALVGESELARCGVLFLDEVTEFRMSVLRALATKLANAAHAPLLVATASPCLCSPRSGPANCTCSAKALGLHRNRLNKVSEILEFQSLAEIPTIDLKSLRDGERGETSAQIRARIQSRRA